MEFGIFFMVLFFILFIRLIAGVFDYDRVAEDIEAKGGKLISKEWSPFGKGWFGEENDRIYKVRYLDKDDNEHEAYVKTSMFGGVYFTDDQIVKYSDKIKKDDNSPDKEKLELKAENERLKAELEKLKNRG